MVTAAMKLKDTPWKESYDQPRQHIKKQRRYFANKAMSSQGYVFSSSHVGMWELDYKKSWESKNWCFWTVVLEKTLESPLDCKEIHPVHPKGDQSWVFIGRTDVEAETPVLWPPDAKSWELVMDRETWRAAIHGVAKSRTELNWTELNWSTGGQVVVTGNVRKEAALLHAQLWFHRLPEP